MDHNYANPLALHNANAPVGPGANPAAVSDARIMPGTLVNFVMDARTANASLAHNTRLSDNSEWFSHLVGLMQTHAKYFIGSHDITQVYANRNNHRDANHHAFHAQATSATTEKVAARQYAQISALAQLNVIQPANFAPVDTIGAIGATRFGPYWNIAPPRYVSDEFYPRAAIPSAIKELYKL
eukprot:g2373.t1